MNFLQILLALLQLAPQVISTVVAVEGAVGAGHGATKKAMVMNMVEGSHPAVVERVSKFVDKTVESMNDGKLFSHSTSSTSTSAKQ